MFVTFELRVMSFFDNSEELLAHPREVLFLGVVTFCILLRILLDRFTPGLIFNIV